MAADPLPWPAVLVPSAEDWSLRGGTRSGGPSFLGNEQIVAAPTARWKAALTLPCFGAAQVLALRRVIALGRAQTWRVGPIETSRAPWNLDFVGGPVTYARGAADAAVDPGFEADPITASTLGFVLAADAPANAVRIAVGRTAGGLLRPGHVLGLGGRLHVIVGQDEPDTGQAVQTLTIRPWLRADHAAGTGVEFGTPTGTMRLAGDDTGALELQLARYGTATLDLVEAF